MRVSKLHWPRLESVVAPDADPKFDTIGQMSCNPGDRRFTKGTLCARSTRLGAMALTPMQRDSVPTA